MNFCNRDRFIALDAECSGSEGSAQEHTITGKKSTRLTKSVPAKVSCTGTTA